MDAVPGLPIFFFLNNSIHLDYPTFIAFSCLAQTLQCSIWSSSGLVLGLGIIIIIGRLLSHFRPKRGSPVQARTPLFYMQVSKMLSSTLAVFQYLFFQTKTRAAKNNTFCMHRMATWRNRRRSMSFTGPSQPSHAA